VTPLIAFSERREHVQTLFDQLVLDVAKPK